MALVALTFAYSMTPHGTVDLELDQSTIAQNAPGDDTSQIGPTQEIAAQSATEQLDSSNGYHAVRSSGTPRLNQSKCQILVGWWSVQGVASVWLLSLIKFGFTAATWTASRATTSHFGVRRHS